MGECLLTMHKALELTDVDRWRKGNVEANSEPRQARPGQGRRLESKQGLGADRPGQGRK